MHKIAGEIRNCEESRRQIMDKSFPEMKKYFGFGCMRLPMKGGSLVNLPEDAQKIYDDLNRKNGTHNSNASYAIRFAAGFNGIRMVLSGMSTLEQMKDNISFMKDFQPLTKEEQQAVDEVTAEFHKLDLIPCTSCHYCVEENHCPKEIRIPDMFACLNKKNAFQSTNMDFYYNNVLTVGHGKASDCIKCGGCERVCPQHLEIRKLLEDVAAEFEGAAEE
jgi:predicted aldo/keto reductase-like oxidoreductase